MTDQSEVLAPRERSEAVALVLPVEAPLPIVDGAHVVVDAIHRGDGRAVIGDACRGCGRCVDVCPQGAIEITFDGGQFVGEAIARISPLVDVS